MERAQCGFHKDLDSNACSKPFPNDELIPVACLALDRYQLGEIRRAISHKRSGRIVAFGRHSHTICGPSYQGSMIEAVRPKTMELPT
jgi:hypothetical protein